MRLTVNQVIGGSNPSLSVELNNKMVGGLKMKMEGLRCVLFVSRNKDNSSLEGFKERRVNFLTTDLEKAKSKFNAFHLEGLPNEVSRMYVSVNSRNEKEVKKKLVSEMVLNDNFSLLGLEAKASSVAMKSENRDSSFWLFDFDEDLELLPNFLEDLKEFKTEVLLSKNTVSGAAVVVSQGFDSRELLEKWSNVSLHRDGLLLLDHT